MCEEHYSIYSDLTQDEMNDDHRLYQHGPSSSKTSESQSFKHDPKKSSTSPRRTKSQLIKGENHTEFNVQSTTTQTEYGSNSLTEEMVPKDLADQHRRNKMSINQVNQLILRKEKAKAEKANAKDAIKQNAIVSFDDYSKQKTGLYQAKVVLDTLLRIKARFEREARFKEQHPGIKSPTSISEDPIVDIVIRNHDGYCIEQGVAVDEDTLSYHIGTCTDYIESLSDEAAISWEKYKIEQTAIEQHMGPVKAFMGYLVSPMNHFSVNALKITYDSLCHETLAFTQYLQHTEEGKKISYAMMASVIVTLGVLSLAGVIPMLILGIITILSVVVWAVNKMQVVEDTQPRDDHSFAPLRGFDMAAGRGPKSSSLYSEDLSEHSEGCSVTTASDAEPLILDETNNGMHSIPGVVKIIGVLFEENTSNTECDPDILTLGST
ncbi:MAG: hypothetical protein CMF42_04690 [Legionellales bacterium]|nr:hypothetical protein [Legionellales bacterium]OUX67316.1 MAG: hypothetical protein CBD38_02880 [bacterium TMED178]